MGGVFLYLYHCGEPGACLQLAQRKGARVDTCGALVRIIGVLRDLEGVWPASD
jgi:hypothetical protein